VDFSKLSTFSIHDRKSKVRLADLSKPWKSGNSFQEFLDGLPDILGAADIKTVINSIVTAVKNNHTVKWGTYFFCIP
jgi:hypothetical protein